MARFDKRSTAEQVSEEIDLTGREAVVTGANAGIGFETTRVLALRGCRVVMACRNAEKARAARNAILLGSSGRIPPERLELADLDLADFDSVRACAKALLEKGRPIHLLINNAGVMLPDRRVTKSGFEAHFGINHLGHFLLTHLLLDRLRESAPARVVVVASEAMQMAGLDAELSDLNWETRKFSGWRSYGSSKLMNALFANELERRYSGDGLVSNSLHPGIVKTELAKDQTLSMRLVGILALPFMKQIDRGAATTVHLAVADEHAEAGGGYYADCQPARAPKLALDREVQARLWKLSEELTGVSASE